MSRTSKHEITHQGRFELLVAAGHPEKRRVDSGEGGIQQAQLARDRAVAQALGRAEPAPQELAVSLGDVDAQLLHQSSRKEDERRTAQGPRAREIGSARSVRQNTLTLNEVLCGPLRVCPARSASPSRETSRL